MNYNVIVEADKEQDMGFAADVALELTENYPGHPWHVNVTGGVLVIKHMKMSAKWGMVRKLSNIRQDWSFVRREVRNAAGELLERANMDRSAWDGVTPFAVEGIPQGDRAIG